MFSAVALAALAYFLWPSSENLVVDIKAEQRRAKIERQIAQLESKRRKEKQFNRQMELSAEIKKLKEQILRQLAQILFFI